jgi:hypothetical protein
MAMKPNGKVCRIMEQIIEDLPTGLTLQFEAREDGGCRLTIYGNLRFGNREIIFDGNGREAASGTSLRGMCRPSWLKEVRD